MTGRASLASSLKTLAPGSRPLHNLHSILPQPFHVPSPLATSSKYTLDHPLHAPLPYTLPRIPPSDRSDPALPALLSYATDDELVNSLHSASAKSASVNPFNLSLNWTSTIDPALAYLSLRSRPSFTPFLTDRSLRRDVLDIYEALRPSGLHQRLVSDLLLRNPDPDTLASILELDASTLKLNQFDNLRTSLVVSIYQSLPRSRRDSLKRVTNLRVAKALIHQGETESVPAVFYKLYNTTTWEPEGLWVLMSLILHLTRHQAVEKALPLLQYLIRHNRLPVSALAVKGDPAHPEAPAIVILSIAIRAALSSRFYERARQLATEMTSVLSGSTFHEPAWDLLLEICRASLVVGSRSELDFVNSTLTAMSKIPSSPDLPRSIVNDYLPAVKPRRAAGFYFGLDEAKRPTLTASNILRLAWLSESRVIKRLDKEVARLDGTEWEAVRPTYEELKDGVMAGRRSSSRDRVPRQSSD